MPKSYLDLLESNKKWANTVQTYNPTFFDDLSQGQHPNYLWIGCADSRVPASEITGVVPGSIFVHRNIANMVVHTDMNMLSVLFYAVKVLKVKHIIVCGHYGCGGVISAMQKEKFGFIDNWLRHIKDVYRLHQTELDEIESQEERANKYVELNVMEQVLNLSKISFLNEEWEKGEFPYIHGWVYSLKDGILKDLNITTNTTEGLESIFQFSKKTNEIF
jgi:carbonic anhydrase